MSIYKEIFAAVQQPMAVIHHKKLCILEANEAFVRLTGYSAEELSRRSVSTIIERCSSLQQIRNTAAMPFTLLTKRKRRTPVWVWQLPLRQPNGACETDGLTLLTVLDLVSHLWIKQQSETGRVLLSGIVDSELRICYPVIGSALEVLESADQGDDDTIFRFIAPAEQPKVLETIGEAVRLKESRTVLVRTAGLKHTVLDMNISFNPNFDGFGTIKEYAFVLHDMKPVDELTDPSMKLKIWMAKRDVSASQLAAATGISPQTVSKLRNGKIGKPSRLTAELIASELQVKVSDIWPETRN